MKACNRAALSACFFVGVVTLLAASARAGEPCVPEPSPTPFEKRVTPYSMTYYNLSADADYTRKMLTELRDAGITRSLTLIYWWQHETLGDDTYWRKDYQPADIGEGYLRKLDLYVNTSLELGMKPSFRLGSHREFAGYWHPADKSKSVENYAQWVGRITTRYRGKIDHYVIGDEENQEHAAWGWDGSAKTYMERMYLPLAKAIRAADPQARISCCGVSSAPSTEWILDLIKLGLRAHGDGVAMNLWHDQLNEPGEVLTAMERIRRVWPGVRFYASGVGYAVNRHGAHDAEQAADVARVMFNLWDIGWESAPYYLYTYSITADTKENYGLLGVKPDGTLEMSDSMRAYATVAQTFYDRDALAAPPFPVRLEQAERLSAADGTLITLAPPSPQLRTFVRGDGQLLIYLTYRDAPAGTQGLWNVIIPSDQWGCAEQIPLTDYRKRVSMSAQRVGKELVITGVRVTPEPTIITLRKIR